MTTFTNSVQLAVLDAVNPTTRLSSGRGGQGKTVQSRGIVTTGASDLTTVVYRMVRIPTNSFIVSVKAVVDALPTTTFVGNVGLYYSDAAAPGDGTSAINIGNTTPVSDSFFAFHYTVTTTLTDITFQNIGGNSVTDGFYVPSASVYPLWDAVQNGGKGRVTVAGFNEQTQGTGYSSGTSALWTTTANSGPLIPGDPGGFVDLCFRNSTAISGGPVTMTLIVDWLIGGA